MAWTLIRFRYQLALFLLHSAPALFCPPFFNAQRKKGERRHNAIHPIWSANLQPTIRASSFRCLGNTDGHHCIFICGTYDVDPVSGSIDYLPVFNPSTLWQSWYTNVVCNSNHFNDLLLYHFLWHFTTI